MLATLNWLVRACGCVLIGVLTFSYSPARGAALDVEVTAYILSTAVVVYWLISDLRHPATLRPGLAVGLGVMGAASSLACTATHGGALVGLAMIAAIVAGADSGVRVGWAVIGTSILAVEIGAVLWQTSTTAVLAFTLLLIVAFVSGRNRRTFLIAAEQSATLVAQLEQLRAEQARVLVLDERTRIAREIHDVLAHSLGALGITIQAVRAVLADHRDIDRAQGLLEQAQRMTAAGLTDTRHAVQALRGDTTRLDEQITALVGTHRTLHGSPIDFQIQGTPGTLTPEATVALTRTAQEALVNTAKHAPHQPVTLHLRYDDDGVQLVVANRLSPTGGTGEDAGTTFSSVDGGYGLTGMRERLLLIHGTLTTTTNRGRWTVTAQVPQ